MPSSVHNVCSKSTNCNTEPLCMGLILTHWGPNTQFCRYCLQINFLEWKLLYFFIGILLTVVPWGSVDNKTALVLLMVWQRTGDKALPEPMMTQWNDSMSNHCQHQDPLLLRSLTLIPAWISNFVHYEVRDEIIYPFSNFNGVIVEVWEWISSFIPHFLRDEITYPCWD